MSQRERKGSRRSIVRQIPLYGAALLLLAGCGTSTNTGNPKTLHGTTKSGLEVSLSLNPDPPVARKETQVSVSIKQSGVKSFQGDKVWISESMPSMSMPKMSVTLKPSGSDTFTGQTLIVMGGQWKFDVHVQHGTTDETQAFTFQVKQ